MSRFDYFVEEKPEPPNKLPYIIGGGVGLIVLAVVLFFAFRNNDSLNDVLATPTKEVAVVNDGSVTETPRLTETNTTVPTVTNIPTHIPTNTTIPTNTPTNTAVPTNTPEPTATLIPQPDLTHTPKPTYTPTPLVLGQLTAECLQDAAFFASPDLNSGQLGVFVAQGEIVTALGRSVNKNWLLVRNQDGDLGWVTSSYFDVSGDIGVLDVPEHLVVTREGGVPNIPTPLPAHINSAFAYWAEGPKESLGNGAWQVDITVNGPADGIYTFSVTGNLAVSKSFIRSENGRDFYTVKISGMSCEGPLNAAFFISRDGQALTVRNEFRRDDQTTSNLFISKPDC